MDVTELARSIVTFLAPFLPYLLKVAEKGAEEAGKRFGAETWDRAKTLWRKFQDKPSVQKAAQDAIDMQNDPDTQAALRLQLKKVLIEDTSLAREIEQLMVGQVVQRVLAEDGSQIHGVQQAADGGNVRQEVIARGESTISDIQQFEG